MLTCQCNSTTYRDFGGDTPLALEKEGNSQRMARMKGLLNPANFAEDTGGGFKEGPVLVEKCVCAVTQRNAREGQKQENPHGSIVYKCIRLDPDTQEPMQNADGESERVEIVLGLGSKSLPYVHPGIVSSADSDEVQDAGDKVGAEGNTLYISKEDWKLHPKTAAAIWFDSLYKAGFRAELIDRMYMPDYDGAVFDVAIHQEETDEKDEKTGKPRTIPYKVVRKIIRAPYEKGKGGSSGSGSGSGGGKGSSASTKKDSGGGSADQEVMTALTPILLKLSEEHDGEKFSPKSLATKVNQAATASGVNPKLIVPMLGLVKSSQWVEENGGTFDMKMVDGMVQFGG